MSASPVSTTAEPTFAVRKRADLIVRQTESAGVAQWNVKDPVTLEYTQLRQEELFLLNCLNGRLSFSQIRERFERRFAPLRLGETQFAQLIQLFQNQRLLTSDAAGHSDRLLSRFAARGRRRRAASLFGVLAIRFRGFDPQRMLDAVHPAFRWCFQPWSVVACLLLILTAAVLMLVQRETVGTRLPGFSAFFHADNLIWILVAISISKILHELGHAIACRHFGGRCHELGVMLLVFAPCLYCNVSDAWMMPAKRHRIAVSAAGIYVELAIAAACTWLWWFTEPGLLNAICLNLMFVCSINTVLFNGNPLLRYDGYYILSDLVEVPNLGTLATRLLRHWLAWLVFGVRLYHARMLPDRRRGMIATYGVASTIWRCFMVVSILWFLHHLLEPYGLRIVAWLISGLTLTAVLVFPATRLLGFVIRLWSQHQMERWRSATLAVVGLGFGATVWLLPIPAYVHAPLLVEPRDATTVYVPVAGRLPDDGNRIVASGQAVEPGDVLAVLKNATLDKEINVLEMHAATLRSRVDSLVALRVGDREAGDRMPTTHEALRNTRRRLSEKTAQRDRLTLRAPCGGTVLPVRSTPERAANDELPAWSGTPIDPKNRGAFLDSGTEFCLLGSANRLDALLVVDQDRVNLVRRGQTVRLWLRQAPGRWLDGVVTEVSRAALSDAPRELAAVGALATMPTDDGGLQPASPSWQVRVQFESGQPTSLYTTGRASIRVDSQTILQRLARYLSTVFSFR